MLVAFTARRLTIWRRETAPQAARGPETASSALGSDVAQLVEVGVLRQTAQGPLLDLPGALGREADDAAGLSEGVDLALGVVAEAQVDDRALLLREGGDGALEGLGHPGVLDLLVGGELVGGEQVAERRVAVLTDALVQRGRGLIGLLDLLDLLERELSGVGDLLVARLVAELEGQLALELRDLAGALGHVDGQADRAAGVLQPALDRLADPQGPVGREP